MTLESTQSSRAHGDERRPYLSVIVPVYNGAAYLDRSLASIRRSGFTNYELIVVDDACTDDSPGQIERFKPDVFIRNAQNLGAYASRNRAAAQARGEVLFYTDADIVLGPDTLARVHHHFAVDGRDCVIGLYSLDHPNHDVCSRYKNTWIRYTYLRNFDRVNWFFTAVGAVRRSLWAECGRFDPLFVPKTGGGDIDFGRRLAAAGVDILGDDALEVTHLKRFDLHRLLRNDMFRAYGFTRLALRQGRSGVSPPGRVANVSSDFAAGVVLSWLATAAVLAMPIAAAAGWVAVAALGAYFAVNSAFYRFVADGLGWGSALRFAPLMFADHVASGLGVAAALARYVASRAFAAGGRA